jgi:gluconolactonase
VARIDDLATKSQTVLCDSYDGKKLNSPNDLVLDAHGGVYFTDPRYGGNEPVEQPVMGVYYVSRDARVTRVIEDLERPNGILVSADGRSLFVAEPNRRELYRYPIFAPGQLGAGSLLFTGDEKLDGGGPDGMSIDERGNLYATYAGVVVLTPQGSVIGRIEIPERPSNCAFGGRENKTLFVTARTSLYAIEMRVAGLPLQPPSR